MKVLPNILLTFCVFSSALAVDQKKSAIMYFDNPDTPDSVVDQAKDFIIEAGGKITHIYFIIKGFAVIAPEKALEAVQTWGTEHSLRVEEDKMVSSHITGDIQHKVKNCASFHREHLNVGTAS
ncbi:hypothetical protein E4U42_003377 [Claviceps africana]|uniref:Inhibitor I9 domain-containing protein n=1 Tax=Claviceps africana TaxID=83212 RepID=A0A8K0J764_9HYPO|nr:hypothetical protein E4U42_003377 [Claviceps africana]